MNRAEIARSAAEKLLRNQGSEVHATVGLDGFVDEIIAVVDTRADFERYVPVDTIATLGKKILGAAGQSSNYELVVKQMKLGGNGPIMANALAAAGMKIAYVGALGYPTAHPVFAELASRSEVYSVAEPGHTDALEFKDGKLMLGKLTGLNGVTWENLVARVGVEKLTAMLGRSRLIAMNNWTMIPHMTAVLEALTAEVLSKLPPLAEGARRTFFIDLADPEKRTREDLRGVLQLLTRMERYVEVTLGLNLKESDQVAGVLGLEVYSDSEARIQDRAAAIRETLGVSCVVVHPRKGAAAATANTSASFKGPFVREPKLSTGAGDNFNAGFAMARTIGLSVEESLAAGVGTSGFYVREGHSPSLGELVKFLRELPEPE
jgi:sugar/nucleoside kinase (ribokinase family)